MDYRKLDSFLAAMIDETGNDTQRKLNVFVRLNPPLSISEADHLKELGVSVNPSKQRMVTAQLTINEVEKLSDKSWVKYLKLSQQLKPVS